MACQAAAGCQQLTIRLVFFSVLDQTFSALSDPTRRAIVARLVNSDGLSVGTLAAPFDVSLPAVIKHLDVLSSAGLITRTRTGRVVTCRLAPAPMGEAMAWLEHQLNFWNARLDALGALVEGRLPNEHYQRPRRRRGRHTR